MIKANLPFVFGLALAVLLQSCGRERKNSDSQTDMNVTSGEESPGEEDKGTAYQPIPLVQLIGMSDLVAAGRVKAVEEASFKFQIDKVIGGTIDSSTVQVRKFVPPAFLDEKPVPYDTTRSMILYLRKSARAEIPWTIIGIGGEGEMPVEDGFIYFEGSRLEGMPYVVHTLYGTQKNRQRFNYDKFLDAITGYSKCITWGLKEDKSKSLKQWVPTQRCDSLEIAAFKKKSRIHDFLIRETLLHQPGN